jgi:uncharacterized delta-60 repeat protein
MRTKLLYCMVIAVLSLPLQSVAQYGELDPTFGVNGIAQTQFGQYVDEEVSDMLLLPNGQILLASTKYVSSMDFMVQRYNDDGTLDMTFGSGGAFTFDNGGVANHLKAMALQEDGKVILLGYSVTSPISMIAVRMNGNGTLDSGFGTNGVVSVTVPSSDVFGNDVVIQPNGKIILAGHYLNGLTGFLYFKIVRLNVNGSVDGSFDTSALLSIENIVASPQYPSVELQSDGKVVITGQGYLPTGSQHFCVMRLNTDGTLDTDFSGDGIQLISLNLAFDWHWPEALAIQPDGRIVVGGYTGYNLNSSMTIMRLFSDGEMDTTFADGGVQQIAPNIATNVLNDVFIQPDGMILGCGYTTEPSGSYDWIVLRLDADGTPDPTFGTSGIVNTGITGFDDIAKVLAVQDDGKILVGGYSLDNNADRYAAIARYESGVDVGVTEYNAESAISIYPNPSTNVFHITLPNDVKNESLTLRNALGQVLLTKRITGTQTQIDLSNFADGIYFLSMDGGSVAPVKLLKQ